MIRVVFLLRKKADLTTEAFYDYWLNTHGPLVASVARDLNMLRYQQVHTIVGDPAPAGMAEARGGMEPIYDGVAEVWFENREALEASMQTDAGRAAGTLLVEDEAKFIDLPNSPLWLAYEYPQVNPTPEDIVARERSTIVKLYYPLRTHAGRDEADAQLYWRTNHGPLIRRQAHGAGIMRYVQVHRTPDPIEDALRSTRGTTVDSYMGHAELWFDRAALAMGAPERAVANERAIEDEAKFIDFQRSTMWLAKEHVFVNHM